MNGYELFRLPAKGCTAKIYLNSATYTLQFEGEKTDAISWLRVTDQEGQTIRLGPGWSAEACWNALTTLERGCWCQPVGLWKDPSSWSATDS